jgi:serine/threonine protein kinase
LPSTNTTSSGRIEILCSAAWQGRAVVVAYKHCHVKAHEPEPLQGPAGTVARVDPKEVDESLLLGQGHFGASFKAVWRGISCVKKTTRSTAFPLLQREMDIIGSASGGHPNVQRVLAVSSDASHPFVLVEHQALGSLERLVLAQRGGIDRLSPVQLVDMLHQVASALQHLHSQDPPVLHRNVALRNVLTDGRKCVLGDAGLAQRGAELVVPADPSAGWVGFPLKYLAPEMFRKYPVFTTQTDVWSFGILCCK